MWRVCIACWILNAKNTNSEYVIFIAFPLQQQLHDLSSMFRYTFITLLVVHRMSMSAGTDVIQLHRTLIFNRRSRNIEKNDY